MATPLIKGNQLESLTEVEGSPEVEITATGKQITYQYVCKYSVVDSAIPLFPSVSTDDSALKLLRVRYVRDGIIARITAIYGAESTLGSVSSNPTADGDPVAEGDSNAMEIPLVQHPSYSGSWTGKEGVNSYLSPQPTAQFTWYKEATSDEVLTEAVRVKNVGKRVRPAGVKTPTVAPYTWLKTGRRVRGVGVRPNGQTIWEITESYQYASQGWDTDIYPDTANDYGSNYLVGAL